MDPAFLKFSPPTPRFRGWYRDRLLARNRCAAMNEMSVLEALGIWPRHRFDVHTVEPEGTLARPRLEGQQQGEDILPPQGKMSDGLVEGAVVAFPERRLQGQLDWRLGPHSAAERIDGVQDDIGSVVKVQ